MDDPILTNEIAPSPPSLGGPAELAERLLEKRRLLAGSSAASLVFGDLTETELSAVLRVAFEVSFEKDEGRYPRLTVVTVYEDRRGELWVGNYNSGLNRLNRQK